LKKQGRKKAKKHGVQDLFLGDFQRTFLLRKTAKTLRKKDNTGSLKNGSGLKTAFKNTPDMVLNRYPEHVFKRHFGAECRYLEHSVEA
jgi:hypothetical protein